MTYKNKTITRHKRGNWWVRVRHNGKVICIYGRTQIEVHNKLKVLLHELENNKIDTVIKQRADSNKCKYTLQQWFDEWLITYKSGCVRACTIDGFKQEFKKLTNLYEYRIDEITSIMLANAINSVGANRTKDRLHNMIKQMFATAFNNRLIEINPASNLPRPKQAPKKQKHALTAEQEKIFVNTCLQDLENYEQFIILVIQGLRKGEMLALRPNDLDFENNTIRIDESYDEQHPDDLETKNKASNRTMPMFKTTREILLKYRDNNPTERIYKKSGATYMLLLDEVLQKANLPRITMHELRHTFITRCHEKQIDEILVQKWVGHTIGSTMTKGVYTHIADDKELAYIDLLNN
ncbi:MAG: site-specific integrase [Clostridiales bacterium]|jgi:integrase|nr:site-specific integrase [Clostridiales bacterium]